MDVPYSTYYKPMGDLPYVSSEQGELIIHTELIYELPSISVLYPGSEEGDGLIIYHGLIISTIRYLKRIRIRKTDQN